MALGKPVIACVDGGGYVELIEDGVDGFLVEATGPAIARAINRLKDRAVARAMGARGREKAQQVHLDESDRSRRACAAGADRFVGRLLGFVGRPFGFVGRPSRVGKRDAAATLTGRPTRETSRGLCT